MQLKILKPSLILENLFKVTLYLIVPSLKLFKFLWTCFGAYLLIEALAIYYISRCDHPNYAEVQLSVIGTICVAGCMRLCRLT